MELMGWMDQITSGWEFYPPKKRVFADDQMYQKCLIDWLQSLKKHEKMMGTLALIIVMDRLQCKAGDELLMCISEGLCFNIFETDRQRRLHQLITTNILDAHTLPEHLSEKILRVLRTCYPTNPRWILALSLCHFVKHDERSLTMKKLDLSRESAFYSNPFSKILMKEFLSDWKAVQKDCNAEGYQKYLVQLAPEIWEIQTSQPWITYLYQNILTTDSVLELLRSKAVILTSFRLDELLRKIVQFIDDEFRVKKNTSTVIDHAEELFKEIFDYARRNEFNSNFSGDNTEDCVCFMNSMLNTLSMSLKKPDSNHTKYILFCSKIVSFISYWSAILTLNKKFTDDQTSSLVFNIQSYVGEKIKSYDPCLKDNFQFFDKLLSIKWPEKYKKQWLEIIQIQISRNINKKWKNDDEKYFKFFTQTILKAHFCDELEHCFIEKALISAAKVLREDEDSESLSFFCGLSAKIFGSHKNKAVVKFIEKLILDGIETHGINKKTSTKNILKFVCEWPISLSIFRIIYNNNALEYLPKAKPIIKLIEQSCKEFLNTLERRNVPIDELIVIRNYHSKICQFFQTMFSRTSGTTTESLETVIGEMQAKFEKFEKEHENYKTFCSMCSRIKDATETSVDYSKLKEVYDRSVRSERLNDLFTIEDVEATPSQYSGLTADIMKQFELIQTIKRSQIFINLWVEVSKNLEETKQHPSKMDWKEVLSDVWIAVKHEICSLVNSIQKETLKLDMAVERFIWTEGEWKTIHEELGILCKFSRKFNDSDMKGNDLDSAVTSIFNVFEIKKNSKSLKWVSDFRKVQELQGDFEHLNQILNTEENQDLTLRDIDETTLEKFPKRLRDMAPSNLAVLQAFIQQRELIQWLQSKKMTDVTEVKVMCNLAMSYAGETPVETDRFLHLHHATKGFAPLLFHLDDVNCLDKLLEKCEEVWENVDQDDKILEKWKNSGEYLQWFKDRESLVGSDQKRSLALAQNINERGVYTIGNVQNERIALGNCVSLTIQDKLPQKSSPQRDKKSEKYDLHALQDLQSKLALIAGEEDQGQQDIAQFVELFTAVKTLAEAFVNLTNAGCMLFNDFTAMITSSPCADMNDRQNEHNLTVTIRFMEQSAPLCDTASLYILQELSKTLRLTHAQWTDYIKSKRLQHYYLNEYNIQQITYLCHQLATAENISFLPDQVLTLLSNDCKSLAPGIIKEARDQAIEINDEDLEKGESDDDDERQSNTEATMTEMDKKKRMLRILVNRERLSEDLAKAAIQAVGYENIDECNNWALLHQYNEEKVQSNLMEFNIDRAFEHQSNEDEELISIFNNKSMHSLTEMINQIIKTINIDESERKIVNAVKTICRRYYEKTKVLTMQDYLSVEHLGKFLTYLHENHEIKEKVTRSMEPPFVKGRPNLIVHQEVEAIPILLSIFMKNSNQPLPTASEVLLCSEETTSEELERFMRRAICKCKSNGQPLFCLAFTEKLKPKVSKSVEDIFEELLQQQRHLNADYQLVILSGSQQHYISECFDKHQVELLERKSFDDILNYLDKHLSTTCDEVGPSIVKIVEASRSGVGKSLYVENLDKQLNKRWFEKHDQIPHMRAFLDVLNRDANHITPMRTLPTPMNNGKVNLIFTPEPDILPALISLYMTNPEQPLPIAPEVLLCCQQTSEEEVERFMRRAMCKSQRQDKRLFTIAYGERIRPEVANKLRKLSESLSTTVHANKEFQLIVLTSDMTFFDWCRDHHVFRVAKDSTQWNSDKILLYLGNESIGEYESIRFTAVAKNEPLPRNDNHLQNGDPPDLWHKTTIRLLEKTINTNHILDRLYRTAEIHNDNNHFIHIDLTPAVKLYFMFHSCSHHKKVLMN
uniref:E3 ubiquitin-protein ligase RNF213-like n=1 Tax=Styela clava TaxID=7725 RepID=UPI00193ADAAB|nr:E3 ubiquitin-protein ligase RNF213-like [Styela clava]